MLGVGIGALSCNASVYSLDEGMKYERPLNLQEKTFEMKKGDVGILGR